MIAPYMPYIVLYTLSAVGFEPNHFIVTPPFSLLGTLYTENSHTPPFLEILSITVLGITLKLHLQESFGII